MKKHQRDNQGRSIKFKDTPQQRYRRNRLDLYLKCLTHGLPYRYVHRIEQIHNTPAKTQEEIRKKVRAISITATLGMMAQHDLKYKHPSS